MHGDRKPSSGKWASPLRITYDLEMLYAKRAEIVQTSSRGLRLGEPNHPRRDSDGGRMGRHVSSDQGPAADGRMGADSQARQHAGADAEGRALADRDSTGQAHAGTDVDRLADLAFVI